jgi:hypothetical protein
MQFWGLNYCVWICFLLHTFIIFPCYIVLVLEIEMECTEPLIAVTSTELQINL